MARKRTVILAIDALDINLVEEFECTSLMLDHYGKTNIAEFGKPPQTMSIWSSFVTGVNKEKEVLACGWNGKWDVGYHLKESWFSKFADPYIVGLPGYNLGMVPIRYPQMLIIQYINIMHRCYSLDDEGPEAKQILETFDDAVFAHYNRSKELFYTCLGKKHDLIILYVLMIDLIGHMHFPNKGIMRLAYDEVESVAAHVRDMDANIVIVSDHGMVLKDSGPAHADDYGYWATNFADLGTPKITDFADIITTRAGV